MPSYSQYKRQIAVLDADDIQWITVKGNHIPIKEGQSKEDAVKSFFESKKDNSTNKNKESKYSPEFEVVRKNALANGSVYGGKYTQKSKAEAYKEYKNDTSSKENMKKANEFVNGTLIDKRNLPVGTKWSPTDVYGNGTGNKKEENSKYNIQHGAKISDIESMINAHADKKAYKSWKEEEEYVAEILKEEGIYAYGNQIKEAMKNVYGDAYIKERKEENKNITLKTNNPVAKVNPNKWGKEWNKRANRPVTLGEAAKSATQTSYALNKKAKTEANYTALEIAYNDVAFTKSPKQNKADMLKAVSNSGAENIDYMKQTISNMPETAFESHNAFRKGLKDTSKWHPDWFKRANKPITLGTALKDTTNIMKKTKELGKLDKKA